MRPSEVAEQLLLTLLRGGPVPAAVVEAKARAAGVSVTTLERAKRRLRVTSTRVGGLGTAVRWVWALPAPGEPEPLIRRFHRSTWLSVR